MGSPFCAVDFFPLVIPGKQTPLSLTLFPHSFAVSRWWRLIPVALVWLSRGWITLACNRPKKKSLVGILEWQPVLLKTTSDCECCASRGAGKPPPRRLWKWGYSLISFQGEPCRSTSENSNLLNFFRLSEEEDGLSITQRLDSTVLSCFGFL